MNVSKVQARKMVLVSCFALILISVYRNRSSEQPADTFRRLWATGVVAFMLSLLADFAPTVAGPFAALTVLGWFVKDGTAIVDNALGSGDFGSGDFGSAATTRGGGGNFGSTAVASGQKPTTGAAVKTTLRNG